LRSLSPQAAVVVVITLPLLLDPLVRGTERAVDQRVPIEETLGAAPDLSLGVRGVQGKGVVTTLVVTAGATVEGVVLKVTKPALSLPSREIANMAIPASFNIILPEPEHQPEGGVRATRLTSLANCILSGNAKRGRIVSGRTETESALLLPPLLLRLWIR
jgi:hypothetical protein